MRFLIPLVCLAALIVAVPANAGNTACAVIPSYTPTYQAPTYTPTYAPAVFVPVPNYTVRLGYDDGEQAKALNALAEAVKGLAAQNAANATDARLRLIEAEIARLRGASVNPPIPAVQPAPQPAAAPAAPANLDGVPLLKAHCAACHAGDARRGGGFAYDFDNLTKANRKAFVEQIASGQMPKGKPISGNVRMDLLLACVCP